MYELVGASIEHLGRLPSELNLSDQQVKELLMFHRIKNRSQNVCPDCVEGDRNREKICFICESKFSEKSGVISKSESKVKTTMPLDANSQVLLNAMKDKFTPKLVDEPQEVIDEKMAVMVKALKSSGVKIIDDE